MGLVLIMKGSCNLVSEELVFIVHLGVSSQSIDMSFCQECGQFFQWSKSFRRHMKTIHNASCFKCIACTKTFKRMDSFVRHRKLMHKSHEKFGVVVCCEQNNLQSMNLIAGKGKTMIMEPHK